MNENKRKPEIVLFAGPNGSGKSTITELLRPTKFIYINADDIQRNLGCNILEAAQIAEKRREECLAANESFCFESVLSTKRNIELLHRAKASGYFIRCYYILTADPQINAARVLSRVSAGGHDVPIDKIFSRYEKALNLVREVVPLCDVCHIYDNSGDAPYRIFKKRKEQYYYCTLKYLWLKQDIAALTGVSAMEKAALNRHK